MDLSDPALVIAAPAMSAVLRALVRAPGARFTMRELAKVAGVSHEAARVVLHRLADHGVVHMSPAGRAVLCGLNQDHLAVDSLTALVTLRDRLVEAVAGEVSGWRTPPVHASLFGSGARGDGTVSSDLDILLVRPDLLGEEAEEDWEGQLAASSHRLRLMTGNPVSYVDTTRAGLREALDAGEPVVDSWQRDTVHLYGRRLDSLLRPQARA